MSAVDEARAAPPLAGLRVMEIGHFVAAPFATRLLGDLGADIIKIEPLSGDPVRQWGASVDGRSLWWSTHGRNKRSIALDLKTAEAKQIVLDLAAHCDVVVENFRPGQLERLGIGASALRQVKPDLIVAHISGYGQDGPGRDRAAFGLIGEAVGGLRYLTNHAPGTSDLPPVRVGVSIGDSLAGLYTAFGVVASLWQRDRVGGDGIGRTLDIALSDSVLSMMEGMLSEYHALGIIKQPRGGGIATAAPTNAYPTADGDWILIGANSDPLFTKLAILMDQPELPGMSVYSDNRRRVENVDGLDNLIARWTRAYPIDALVEKLSEADIPHSKVYNAADCAQDEQFRYRGMVREVQDPAFEQPVLQAGIVPHVSDAPGSIRWAGPDIGQHTDEILSDILGMEAPQRDRLRNKGVMR